ncbi:MAG: pilus assembly protein [Rhizobiaceae bacterium]|nr:pilus assembly protein [Rhizobiaceae bacterium]
MSNGVFKSFLYELFQIFLRDRGGNFGITTTLLVPLLVVSAGGVVDMSQALAEKANVQEMLDGGVLAASSQTDATKQRTTVEGFLAALTIQDPTMTADDIAADLSLTTNADGSLTGSFQRPLKTSFLGMIGLNTFNINVTSTAIAAPQTAAATASPCIYVLANKTQALLVNSGANVASDKCEIEVDSTSNPAFIMNSNAALKTAEFCVKGTQYINNGGTITNFHAGCSVDPDPYAGKLTEPAAPSSCTSDSPISASTYTLQPGVHCNTTFNGSPTITFAPGLHIIKGTMIINSNATVIANGVTFYFPDTSSRLLFNGGVTLTASAPTSGAYQGILMFEKTSDATNNANKQQFVFNGSKGESLQGIIYLPNRDVTYNSTSNSKSNISLVVDTMIMNSSNWQIEPYTGGTAFSPSVAQNSTPRLIR